MNGTVPTTFRVWVIARRLDGTVSNVDPLIAVPSRITYDVQSIESDIAFSRQGMVPKDRTVRGIPEPEVFAVSKWSIGDIALLPGNEVRLTVPPEAIAWDLCGEGV